MKWVDGNIISDSGHTCINKGPRGFNVFQHSIVETFLSDEDRFMSACPEEAWEQMSEEKSQ